MTLETKESLDAQTIHALQELIEINIDSYNGLNQASDQTSNTYLVELFGDLAEQRVGQAMELQKFVIRNDETPLTKGSIAGRVHRAIMDWREAFGGGPLSVLKEAIRGEDYIKAKYEAVLARTAGSAVTDVLNRHYAAVKQSHEQIKSFRDTLTIA